ncbi:MAG: TonB dependent receptor [Verrucomicrobia bacterium ADurb.Bin474]|nr:MAG: TonB dependent receptor [Verrucomicrobia bacterium ADurb.Bin474]
MKTPPGYRYLSLLAAGAFALSTAPAVYSQSQEETPQRDEVYQLDVMEITGSFAASLAVSAEKKQLAPLIVEVISAEDIGKLPDTSIAESLARLPGIATQRVNGRAQILSIRGLNENFSSATLNGREQVTTGSVRAIEFDQYPAELLAGAVVYKTGDAGLVAQGIAGVVDLRTVRPLSYGERSIAASSYYEWTELDALNAGSERGGWRYSASYIDQFADDTVGIAIGFASTDKPGQGKQWNSWGYPRAYYDDANPLVIGGAKPFIRSSALERNGLLGVIEWKPQENIRSTLDLYYTKFEEEQMLRGIEFPLQWSSAVLEPGYTADRGLVTQGAFSNVKGVMRNDIVTRDADIYAIGWNLEITDLGAWTANFDVGYSKINREDTVLETYSGTGTAGEGATDTLGFTMGGDRGATFSPSINYADANLIMLTSPQGWGGDVVPGGQLGYLKSPESEDKLLQLKAFATRDMDGLWNLFSKFEAGVTYTTRDKYEYENGFYLAGKNGATSLPLPSKTGVSDLSFIGIPGQISYDPIAALNSGIYDLIQNPNADVLSADWDVEEVLTTFYAKMDIESSVMDIPLTGNIGFQMINADQSSKGAAATGVGTGVVRVPVDGSHDYWDFVPSLNLNFLVGEGKYVRMSAARQLARQRMDDMRAGTNYGFNAGLASSTDLLNSPWSGSGGNPELEPWRANALDLSYEQYFSGGQGYFAITGFYKELENYTYNQNLLTDFSGFPTAGVTPALYQGFVSRPANGPGGEIKGVEGTLSLTGDLFSEYLSGFGLILSGSYTDSTVRQDINNPASPIPGLSEKVANATLYYEKAGFSARVSSRYRSDYLANLNTFGPRGRNYRTVVAETVVDAQVSYTFQSGPLENMSVILQAYNLTNEPLATYDQGDSRLVVDYQEYGVSYSVGVSYKF